MKGRADNPSPRPHDDGWDESVLVWNATIARISAPPAAGAAGKAEVDPDADQPEGDLRTPARMPRCRRTPP